MGLFAYTIAGGGFILIGAWESFLSSLESLKSSQPSPPLPTPPSSLSTHNRVTKRMRTGSSPVTFTAISALSLLFVINSLISLSDAISSKDHIGFALQLEVIAIALVFLLYSIFGLSMHIKNWFRSPSAILNMLCLFAFGQEFFFFYVRRKDPNGVENRYYDLFLVPIGICVFSTFLELKNPSSNHARLGRGVGLIFQGMWILQMGFAFFSEFIVQGCSLQEKSRGNYTVKCKGHPEYHRGSAIATLQFNCHLALLVSLVVGVYAIVCKIHGVGRDSSQYRPLGAEMQHMEGQAQFTLDSGDDLDDDEKGIKEEGTVEMQKAIVAVPQSGVNGTH
ncbi:hypothetical protein M9H77_15426 [Catharanthus roseus]|uniref:Uncharacterized protein n=1 Tax=Catharanthus roseus TaxID=4058 RepID=A0ACC0B0V5_CATRO|nr:hypothetical protein M9H77_15426 [Catharanthus roseus]